MKKTYSMIAFVLMTMAGISHGQVLVTPGSMGVWSFGSADGNGDTTNANSADVTMMVNGPATPPLGSGSAELATASGAGSDGVFISTNSYDGVKLSALT